MKTSNQIHSRKLLSFFLIFFYHDAPSVLQFSKINYLHQKEKKLFYQVVMFGDSVANFHFFIIILMLQGVGFNCFLKT